MLTDGSPDIADICELHCVGHFDRGTIISIDSGDPSYATASSSLFGVGTNKPRALTVSCIANHGDASILGRSQPAGRRSRLPAISLVHATKDICDAGEQHKALLASQQDAAAWLNKAHEQGGRRPQHISRTLLEQAESLAQEERVANLPASTVGVRKKQARRKGKQAGGTTKPAQKGNAVRFEEL